MIGLDLQESPPQSSCFVLRVKSEVRDGGQSGGEGRGGGGGVWSNTQRVKRAEGFSLILAMTTDMSLYVQEGGQRERERDHFRSPHSFP